MKFGPEYQSADIITIILYSMDTVKPMGRVVASFNDDYEAVFTKNLYSMHLTSFPR